MFVGLFAFGNPPVDFCSLLQLIVDYCSLLQTIAAYCSLDFPQQHKIFDWMKKLNVEKLLEVHYRH